MTEPEPQPVDEAGEPIPTPEVAEVAEVTPQPEPEVAPEPEPEPEPFKEFVAESQVHQPYEVPADFPGHTAFTEADVKHIL